MKPQETQNYKVFFNEIIATIEQARYDAFKSMNYSQINQNFTLGKIIIERQKEFGWGKSIVERLSKDLKKIIDGEKVIHLKIFGICDSFIWSIRTRRIYLN